MLRTSLRKELHKRNSQMAHKGTTLTDPATGDSVEFVELPSENGGERLTFRFTVKPNGFKPVEHIHLFQDETFQVLSGTLTYRLNGKEAKASASETVLLPKGQAHTHFNAEQSDLVMLQSVTPALDSEIFLENLFGLSNDGKVKNGQPELLQILVWLRSLQTKTYLAAIPIGLQNALAIMLAPLARLLGYRASYEKYSDAKL